MLVHPFEEYGTTSVVQISIFESANWKSTGVVGIVNTVSYLGVSWGWFEVRGLMLGRGVHFPPAFCLGLDVVSVECFLFFH
jgi:hypothetical protein